MSEVYWLGGGTIRRGRADRAGHPAALAGSGTPAGRRERPLPPEVTAGLLLAVRRKPDHAFSPVPAFAAFRRSCPARPGRIRLRAAGSPVAVGRYNLLPHARLTARRANRSRMELSAWLVEVAGGLEGLEPGPEDITCISLPGGEPLAANPFPQAEVLGEPGSLLARLGALIRLLGETQGKAGLLLSSRRTVTLLRWWKGFSHAHDFSRAGQQPGRPAGQPAGSSHLIGPRREPDPPVLRLPDRALGYTDQPLFLNQVIEACTELPPQDLLAYLSI